jgi:hypothetical protein
MLSYSDLENAIAIVLSSNGSKKSIKNEFQNTLE